MADDLFQTEDQTPDFTIDPEKDYLEELVGEGKKFQDVKELARAKYEADRTIEFRNKQFDRLREDYLKEREQNNTRAGLEEILAEIKQLKSASNTESENSGAKETDKSAINLDDLDNRFMSKLEEHELRKKREANMGIVKDKLRERFGENWQAALREQTRKMGLKEDVATRLAEESPEAFIRTLGLDRKSEESFSPPPKNQYPNFQSKSKAKPGTWGWYEDLKAQDPKTYWSKTTQLQMLKDADRLGAAFDQ